MKKLENTDTTDKLLGEGDTFHFFMPLEKSDTKDTVRYIQGIASTGNRDLQGEVVVQKGIDFSYFLSKGYINDDHKDGPENKVGEPTECKLTPDGLWIKGFLYKGKERSDHWWEHITVLSTSDSTRKVGFSIQGKVLRRDKNTILSCWLQDVAITASPVNTNTWAEIAKSLNGQNWCNNPTDAVCKACGKCGKGCNQGLNKEEEEKKAMSAAGCGSLIPQSLDGKAKVQTYKSLNDRVSYSDAVVYLQEEKGYALIVAKALADAIFSTQGTR